MSAEPEPPTGAGFKYWAFLSYSHQDNLETRKDGERGRIQWADLGPTINKGCLDPPQ